MPVQNYACLLAHFLGWFIGSLSRLRGDFGQTHGIHRRVQLGAMSGKMGGSTARDRQKSTRRQTVRGSLRVGLRHQRHTKKRKASSVRSERVCPA